MIPSGPAKHCGIIAEVGNLPTRFHARQNQSRVGEEFYGAMRRKLAFAFRVCHS